MISETRIVHELWNFLERNGYDVAGEVKVVSEEAYYKIWSSKPILERFKPYIDGSGAIRFKKRGISTTIDLVATDGREFIGFEVKDDFNELSSGTFWDQMICYANGGMLDRLFLVFHDGECIHGGYEKEYEHILKSYGHLPDRYGIGLIVLEGNSFDVKIDAKKLNRISAPKLERNEAWLKHVLWNYFESKYDVEGEAISPKSMYN